MSAAENKAVFLSYASQDAEAAKKVCDALRAAGVEVWFDQNELVGGDAWDAKIGKQIKDCALFVLVISGATQARGRIHSCLQIRKWILFGKCLRESSRPW
ncbi:MAG: toll/interleukin-1 receptor domain-containing protein [Undibacterium sp.]|nr:toll/interleukin-1 receptor domain-containing protein [Opitutaceae bacterium]